MANTIKVIDKVAAVAAEIFEEVSYLANNSIRSMEDEFVGAQKIGNKVRIRIPSRYQVQSDTFSGGMMTYSRGTAANIAQETRDLLCDKSNYIRFDLTSEELAVFSGSDAAAMTEILKQPMSNLARKVDLDGFGLMMLKGGSRVALLSDANGFTIDDASVVNSRIAEQIADTGNRYLALSASDMSKAQISAKGLFQASNDIANQYKSGVIASGQGFEKWFDTQSLPTLTIGTAFGDATATSGITITTTVSTAGQATIALTGDATQYSKTFFAGQAIQIAGCYAIDPQTLLAIPTKATFIVQADCAFSGAGALAAMSITPMYTVAGNITLANLSAYPQSGAKVTVLENLTGTNNGKLCKVAIGWQKKALAFASIPLPKDLSGADCAVVNKNGIDIRVTKQYQINSNAQATVIDLQYGFLNTRPEWVGSAAGFKL